MSTYPQLNELIELARRAGEILRAHFGKEIEIRHKGPVDLVTEADHRSEEFLIAAIQERYPQHKIITEESGLLEGNPQHCWYIDPLDGTMNYAHGVPLFAVSLAYVEQDCPKLGVVYDPIHNECFSAERGKGAYLNQQRIHVSTVSKLESSLLVTGFLHSYRAKQIANLEYFRRFLLVAQGIRRFGSAALDLCYVAAGRLDGYWEIGIAPWDIAAGALIVEEAGGRVTNINGDTNYFRPPFDLLAANPNLHFEMRAVLTGEAGATLVAL
ncbi:MAG: inositol monophosphatase [Anaerolineae bacterium]|nr:inositol monophosphatase [Anaerolineae bacterium]